MQLSEEVVSKIESLINGCSFKDIILAQKELTAHYRERKDNRKYLKSIPSDTQRYAYLIARLPATYSVVCHVLMETVRRCGNQFESLLDIGAGPGTVLLAARQTGIPLSVATLLEKDPGFIRLGKELAGEANWICQDAALDTPLEPHDLVVASYSLGEMEETVRFKVLEKLWRLTKKVLVVIEPGTPLGFDTVRKIRENLILNSGNMVAPCPHSQKCPMNGNDWCHFFARNERTSLHRKIKEATLNYEDEKFSYCVFSKNKIEPCLSRVVRHPFQGSGYIKLQLCSRNGLEEKVFTKKEKTKYRKTKWGDELN